MTMKPFVLTLLAACFLAAPSGVTHAQEPALNKTATDADLQWSTCPPGLPEGCTLSVLRFRQGQWRGIAVDIEPREAEGVT